MTPCAHLPEVELARDHRLDASGSAVIAEHVRTCAPCQRHAAMLAAVAPALAAVPVPAHDVATARRDRDRLLDTAGRAPARFRSWTFAIAGLALATTALILIVAFDDHVAATHVTVQPTTARWSRHDERGTTLVRLEEGALDLRVIHDGEPHRLVVSLPDGELDDLGTTFHVAVTNGRTTEVTVREGAIALRLVGQAPVFLVAGEHWSASRVAAVVTAHDPAPSIASSPAPIIAPPNERTHTRAPRAPTDESEYAAAARLFERGELVAAATALRSFIAHHGDDAHAEDAGYLLVLALHRSGDDSARAAARDFLERFPHAFRRAEVEQLARDPTR